MIWNLLAYAFTGADDSLQLWCSLLTTLFSGFAFFALFYWYPRRKPSILFLNYVSWLALLLLTLLEVIFLVSLLLKANTYEVVRTNYGTLRLVYYHSAKQITLLFLIGVFAVVSLIAEAVAAQRLAVAIEGKLMMTSNVCL